jgi:hypothetical protein
VSYNTSHCTFVHAKFVLREFKLSKRWEREEYESAIDTYLQILKNEKDGNSIGADDTIKRLHKRALQNRGIDTLKMRMATITKVLKESGYNDILPFDWPSKGHKCGGEPWRIIEDILLKRGVLPYRP